MKKVSRTLAPSRPLLPEPPTNVSQPLSPAATVRTRWPHHALPPVVMDCALKPRAANPTSLNLHPVMHLAIARFLLGLCKL